MAMKRHISRLLMMSQRSPRTYHAYAAGGGAYARYVLFLVQPLVAVFSPFSERWRQRACRLFPQAFGVN